MGGAVSQGVDNDDIINKLKGANYIKTAQVEKVFRLVDRGYYIVEEDRSSFAYKDTAWRKGNLHLSAPCIYAQVLEGLQIEKGMSFLNIGSGTGYLSTMAGLILGPYGTNHGVELHGDVIAYARERLESFLNESGAIDVLDFCKPQFVQGNAYLLEENCQRYDRVYCGAALMPSTQEMMQNLLKIGGVLVAPVSDQLLQIERNAESSFSMKSLLPVSFSSLVHSSQQYDKYVALPPSEILCLQEMCRLVIRQRLRQNVEKTNTDLEPSLIHKIGGSFGVSYVNDSDDTDEMSDSELPISFNTRQDQINALLDLATSFPVMRGLGNKDRILFSRDSLLGAADDALSSLSANEEDENADSSGHQSQEEEEDSAMVCDQEDVACERQEVMPVNESGRPPREENCDQEEASEDDMPSVLTEAFDICLRTTEAALKRGLSESSAGEESAHAASSHSPPNDHHKAVKREKFDSGIGDEADVAQASSSDSDLYDVGDSDDLTGVSTVFESIRRRGWRRRCGGRKHGRSFTGRNKSTDRLTSTDDRYTSAVPVKKYRELMTESIKMLPLPVPLKVYINYDRNL